MKGGVGTWLAIVMVGLTFACVALPPLLPGYDPYSQSLAQALTPPFTDLHHPLGTDPLGRDLLSRLSLAGRTSIFIAGTALCLSLAVGAGLGLIAGYFGGVADLVITTLADLDVAIPILLLLVIVVAIAGPGSETLILVLGLTTWVGYARLARALSRSLRERDFVQSARSQGASALWILRVHLLPAIAAPLTILASFNLGVLIVLESSLSYLGLGIPPPTPSWGGMLNEGQDYLQIAPYLCLLPGLAISLLVSGVQILSQRLTGEGRLPERLAA